MMRILSCLNCEQDSLAPDAVTIQLQMHKWKFCDKCRHTNDVEHMLYFCSPKCMLTWLKEHEQEFLKEVAKFRAERLWDHKFNPPPDSGENAKAERLDRLKSASEYFTDPKPSSIISEAKNLCEEEGCGCEQILPDDGD